MTSCKTGPAGQGLVTLQGSLRCSKALISTASPGPDFIHLIVEAALTPTAKRSMAIRISLEAADGDAVVRRLQRGQRRKLITDKVQARFAPRLDRRFWRRDQAAARDRGAGGWRRRRADRGTDGFRASLTVGQLGNTRGDTVHFDIVDRAGNMISSTPSVGWLHSSPVAA